MPPDKRLGLDDHQRVGPVEELRQGYQDQATSGRDSPRFGLSLLKQGKLPAQEQILSRQSSAAEEEHPENGEQRPILSMQYG